MEVAGGELVVDKNIRKMKWVRFRKRTHFRECFEGEMAAFGFVLVRKSAKVSTERSEEMAL